MIDDFRRRLRGELESPAETRRFGRGWLSGVAALVLSLACLGSVLCLNYPDVLSVPDIRRAIDLTLFRIALHAGLLLAFTLAMVSVVLRDDRVLGLTAMTVVLIATALGGSRATSATELTSGMYLGLDWFMLNLVFT